MEATETVLDVVGLQKRYGGTVALSGVSFDLRPGEVHALVGENGAGKSTLIKILAGAIAPDAGTITIKGKVHDRLDSQLSLESGISVIYQEFMLVPDLTVAENIFLGQRLKKAGRTFRFGTVVAATRVLFQECGIVLDPSAVVRDLSPSYQQLVEIAKAISRRDCRILIMDEPTAPLAEPEVRLLFRIIGLLKAKGVSIIYVSHRMEEIFAISDRVSVLRDGIHVKTMKTVETNPFELIKHMVGRELSKAYPPKILDAPSETVTLEARSISTSSFLKNVSFRLRRGEILGLGGLMGSGRTETAKALCGLVAISSGTLSVNGSVIRFTEPREAIRAGIGYIPEDRKNLGLLLDMSVNDNATLAELRSLSRLGVIQKKKQRGVTTKLVDQLRIKTSAIDVLARHLSGGNQQKVVLAKWLATTCDILIFDEPTRGIDVAAKFDIYTLMHNLVAAGKSILMISSEMNELIGMSDRIAVMHEGSICAVFEKEGVTQDMILKAASGIEGENT